MVVFSSMVELHRDLWGGEILVFHPREGPAGSPMPVIEGYTDLAAAGGGRRARTGNIQDDG